MTTNAANAAGQVWTIETLREAFASRELTRAEVKAAANGAALKLPRDFFAPAAAAAGLRAAITAAKQFAPGAQGNPGATTRQSDLHKAAAAATATDAAAGAKLEIPNPAPQRIVVSNRLRLDLVGQNADMVAYRYFLKGKLGMFVAMRKYNPETALKFGPGLFAGKNGVAIFDRDGVFKDSTFLNDGDKEKAQDVIVADGLDASAELKEAGVATVVATNQGSPGMSFEAKAAANVRVVQQLADAGGWVSLVIMCPYLDAIADSAPGDVDARKPAAGMLLFAKALAELDKVPVLAMVGDQVTDVRSGQDAGLPTIQLMGPDGRAKDEIETAKKKGHPLPEIDRDPKRHLEKYGVAQAIAHLIANVPPRPMTKHALRVAAPLAATDRTAGLPDAWLHAASDYMHRHAPLSSTYDLRVALHGADAKAAMEAIGAGDKLDTKRELLLMSFTDEWDLQANVYAFDVVRKTFRKLGTVESEDLEGMLDWDGRATPGRFAKAVLLPVAADAWDSGKRLAGFDDIAEFTPKEPIDFPALEQRRGVSHRPVMGTIEHAVGRQPRELGFYTIAGADGGKALTITSGNVTHTIEAAPGTTFTGAGWSKRASIDRAILGLTDPRREGEGWHAAQDAIADSNFGSNDRRPLLWFTQSDGVVRFVALSANEKTPAALEIGTLPLTVKLHPAT